MSNSKFSFSKHTTGGLYAKEQETGLELHVNSQLAIKDPYLIDVNRSCFRHMGLLRVDMGCLAIGLLVNLEMPTMRANTGLYQR